MSLIMRQKRMYNVKRVWRGMVVMRTNGRAMGDGGGGLGFLGRPLRGRGVPEIVQPILLISWMWNTVSEK